MTNAHVVAGSTTTTVTPRRDELRGLGRRLRLERPTWPCSTCPAPAHRPSQLSAEVPGRGTPAAALGYPGGGDLTVTAAAVTATYSFLGPDIYGDGAHAHSVVELRGEIRRGNSGGPLVVGPGVVGARRLRRIAHVGGRRLRDRSR